MSRRGARVTLWSLQEQQSFKNRQAFWIQVRKGRKKKLTSVCHILSTICLDRKNNSLLPPQLIPHQRTLPQTRHCTSAIWDLFHPCCNALFRAVCTHCSMCRRQEQGVGNLGTHSCDEASSVQASKSNIWLCFFRCDISYCHCGSGKAGELGQEGKSPRGWGRGGEMREAGRAEERLCLCLFFQPSGPPFVHLYYVWTGARSAWHSDRWRTVWRLSLLSGTGDFTCYSQTTGILAWFYVLYLSAGPHDRDVMACFWPGPSREYNDWHLLFICLFIFIIVVCLRQCSPDRPETQVSWDFRLILALLGLGTSM